FGDLARIPIDIFSHRAGECLMNAVTRRVAMKLTAAAGLVAAGASIASAADDKDVGGKDARQAGSGPTVLQRTVTECKIDLSRIKLKKSEAMTTACFFGRMSPDPSPGRNVLTISGLPNGTRGIS